MKYISSVFFIVLLLFLALTCKYSNADEIYLKNGDRISGKILNMEDNKLLIKTSYSGEISITWSEVINLNTDHEISVLLSDDTRINGNTKKAENGKMSLSNGKIVETVSFPLSDVKTINPAPYKKEPAVKIKARVNVGYSSTSGNTESKSSHFDGKFTARTTQNRYTISGELNRSEESGINTVSNSMANLSYDHFLNKKWYLYSNALFEKDKFKDLNFRSGLGIGGGYQFLETPLTNLSFEAGINYINSEYTNAPDEGYPSARWAFDFERYFFNKSFQLFHSHEGFVSIGSTSDIFIISQTGIRVPLFKNINATLQYNLDWEKNPAPGRKKSDSMLIFSLGYQIGH